MASSGSVTGMSASKIRAPERELLTWKHRLASSSEATPVLIIYLYCREAWRDAASLGVSRVPGSQ